MQNLENQHDHMTILQDWYSPVFFTLKLFQVINLELQEFPADDVKLFGLLHEFEDLKALKFKL